ncbi:MAG: archease [Candidatus Dormibacteria bacterium]
MVLHPRQIPDGSAVASGHRLAGHTADVIVEAWGATREECIEHAVLGLIESFVELSDPVSATHTHDVELTPVDESELLIAALDEVIYVVDTTGDVAVRASVHDRPGRKVRVRYDTVPLEAVRVIGPAPKAVTRHALHFGPDDHGWRCSVVIDI